MSEQPLGASLRCVYTYVHVQGGKEEKRVERWEAGGREGEEGC